MRAVFVPFIFCVLLSVVTTQPTNELQVLYKWSTVEVNYEDEKQMAEDTKNGDYIPQNIIITDSDYYAKKELYFVATPRFLPGSPVSLSTISNVKDSQGNYKLTPYPNLDMNDYKKSKCDAIIFVRTIKIDIFDRLWVLDGGMVNQFAKPSSVKRLCPPKILIFDLKSNALIRKFEFPENVASCITTLGYIELEVSSTAEDTIAYISDYNTYSMYVYKYNNNKVIKISHPFYHIEPQRGFYNVNNISFTFVGGLYALALDTNKKEMYFHGITSGKEYKVPIDILKSDDLSDSLKMKFQQLTYDKPTHATNEIITKSGNLIWASLEDNTLYIWNITNEFVKDNIQTLIQDEENLRYVSGMKLLGEEEQILVTTSTLYNVIANGKNAEGIVFRIMTTSSKKI